MSKKEKARNLILKEVEAKKKVDFFLGSSLREIPTEENNASVIGMYCGNVEEANGILHFLENAFSGKAFEVEEIPIESPKGDYLKGLSVVLC